MHIVVLFLKLTRMAVPRLLVLIPLIQHNIYFYSGKIPTPGHSSSSSSNNSVQRDGNNMDRDQPDAKKGYKGKHPRLGKWVFNICPLIYYQLEAM